MDHMARFEQHPEPPCPHVTQRQWQVLDLLARGYTNARIGQELGISIDGAKWHVGEVLGSFGVGSRVEAGHLWRDHRDELAA